eukprot:snap_masked-scaffold_5-processed-gene-8.50-mRNA-1 protein AED:1.00 eAED:1.00 QI:0/0/0/0/1/1/2/0/67
MSQQVLSVKQNEAFNFIWHGEVLHEADASTIAREGVTGNISVNGIYQTLIPTKYREKVELQLQHYNF